jgi:RNA polymerase sigma factor (sigma-70 family)
MAVAPRAILVPVPSGASRVLVSPVTRGSSDQRLVARVASGDDRAFEEIFDCYGPALLSFCTHMLGSREWGEDALQLTFVAAYKALRRGGCDGALRPWLYAIARNRCVSELRARREIPDSDRVSAERRDLDGPASLFERREQLREIVEDIQRLPADQRAALVMFELGDQSHEEIASVLGVRRDKVKALIFQAREGLYRGRSARETACSEVRERVANARGKASARGIVRAHIDRCPPCQAFEREVRRQRAALAVVLPVALGGKLKVLVLSSAIGHGSIAAGVTGAGGAASLSGVTTAGSGSGMGMVAGPGSLGAGAAASATGSASTAVSGAVSAAAGGAAPTVLASALGGDAVAGVGVGALASSGSVASAAKLATVLAIAVGVGGVARNVPTPAPRPHVSVLAGRPGQPAPLRSPLQPLVSGIADPLASPTQPAAQPEAGGAAPGGPPPMGAASTVLPSSNAAPPSLVNPAAVTAPSALGAGSPASPVGTTSAPAASAPADGSATTIAASSGNSTTTAGTTTTTASSSTGSGTSPSTTTTASSPTSASTRSSPGSSATQGTSDATSGTSVNRPSDSTAQEQSSGSDSGGGVTHLNGNRPPITPPGCVNNPAPGCASTLAAPN